MFTINNSESVTVLQISLLGITFITINTHVFITPSLIQTAGKDGWISVIIAFVIIMIWFFLLMSIHKRTSQHNLFMWLREKNHRNFFALLGAIVVFFLAIMGGVTLRETITWANLTFLPDTPKFIIAIFFGFACIYMAKSNLQTICTINLFLLLFIALLGFFVAIANDEYKNYGLLLPMFENGFLPVIKGVIYPISAMFELFLLILLQHRVQTRFRYYHFTILAVILTMLTLGTLTGAITEFGSTEAARQRFPSYEEWGLASIGHFIEHLNFLSIYQWLSGAFIRTTVFLYLIREIFPKIKWLPVSVLAFIEIFALIPISDIQYSQFFKKVLIPFTGLFFLIISFVIFITLLFKSVEEREEKNRS
ncbi:endospore germination permease [Bacillaceae bacterium Marseille-Q3522]|nr:endospore germination permease [Bacillaceae bacterium Marseille-Q3522]